MPSAFPKSPFPCGHSGCLSHSGVSGFAEVAVLFSSATCAALTVPLSWMCPCQGDPEDAPRSLSGPGSHPWHMWHLGGPPVLLLLLQFCASYSSISSCTLWDRAFLRPLSGFGVCFGLGLRRGLKNSGTSLFFFFFI